MLRVLCIRNEGSQATPASRAVAQGIRELRMAGVEVVESDSAHFHPLDAVIGCDRLAIIDDAAHATPHYKLIAEAFEAASDMNLGVPTDMVILAVDKVSAVPGIVSHIRDFAELESANRRDNSLCKTDACDICIGETACIDKVLVRPEPAR